MGLEIRRTVYGPRSRQVANQLPNIAYLREEQNDTSGAIRYLRETVDILRGLRPETDPTLIGVERLLSLDLCTTGSTAEGDSLLRQAIAKVPAESAAVLPHRLRAALGYCLTREKRFAEAEPLLLAADAGLRAIPTASAPQRSQGAQWLASLYDAWGKPDEAAKWKAQIP
jgi:uncharacterized protein HemY